jgi:hypothetical protein
VEPTEANASASSILPAAQQPFPVSTTTATTTTAAATAAALAPPPEVSSSAFTRVTTPQTESPPLLADLPEPRPLSPPAVVDTEPLQPSPDIEPLAADLQESTPSSAEEVLLMELTEATEALGPSSDDDSAPSRRPRRKQRAPPGSSPDGSDKKEEKVVVIRRSARPRVVPDRLADSLPEDEMHELEQTGFDLSEYDLPAPREQKWEVERILGMAMVGVDEFQYEVKWMNHCKTTWEPAANFKRMDVVHEWWLRYWLNSQQQMRAMLDRLAESSGVRRDELGGRGKAR